MKFLKTYRKVKDTFKHPHLHWYFGTWKNFPGLPIWRIGPQIRVFKHWGDYKITDNGVYEWTKQGRLNRPWLSKHLPPIIQLPIWMTFMFHSFDVIWKTKWSKDDIHFEFNPQLSIVFFGLCFGVIATDPEGLDDVYWESIIEYLYVYDRDLEKTIRNTWISTTCGGYAIKPLFNPNWLKKPADIELARQICKTIIEERTQIN